METTKSNSDEKATKIISTDSKELNVGTEMETLRSSAEILEDIRKKYNGTKKNPYITSKLNNAKFKIDQTMKIKNDLNFGGVIGFTKTIGIGGKTK